MAAWEGVWVGDVNITGLLKADFSEEEAGLCANAVRSAMERVRRENQSAMTAVAKFWLWPKSPTGPRAVRASLPTGNPADFACGSTPRELEEDIFKKLMEYYATRATPETKK